MQLYMSANSPYARKARLVAYELGLHDSVKMVEVNPRDPSTGFWEINPLAKIPALMTNSGHIIYDSPVICEYLNEVEGDGHLLSQDGQERWRTRTLVALVDGVLDAGMAVRLENMRPEEERSADWIEKQLATASRGMDTLEKSVPEFANNVDLGTIGVACAIAWLQLRHGDHVWLSKRPQLNEWYGEFVQRESFQKTLPDQTR
jgi:glutathione S-transferase